VIRTLRDALIVTRTDGSINRVNPAAERLLGKESTELRGVSVISLVAESQRADFSLSENHGRTRETILLNAAGEAVPVTYTCAELAGDDPALCGHVITVHNISERKIAEQRIRYLARIDALTKVPNRMQFQHLLQRALARARRGKHRLALIYMDVDKFKEINDTFGHTAGDLCLETLTTRLRSLLPEGSVIGRLAGDEFGVVLDNLDPARNLRAEVVATTRLLHDGQRRDFPVSGRRQQRHRSDPQCRCSPLSRQTAGWWCTRCVSPGHERCGGGPADAEEPPSQGI
jgi:diguanylate cyclase (GGDEF)-like protein/PAS domain S-box-containing protein